eukprot:SAG31_NODE_21954_length_537_cov_0.883562_1_plen_75_part_00
MKATEVCESHETLSGLWRVSQSDDSQTVEPEDYILMLHEAKLDIVDTSSQPSKVAGAKLSAGRLTAFLEGVVSC